MAKRGVPVYGPPKPVRATELNLSALRSVAKGRPEFPNQIAAVDAPHLRRCIAAGLLEVSADRKTLRITPAGIAELGYL